MSGWMLGLAVWLLVEPALGQALPARQVTAEVLSEGYSPTVTVSGRPLAGAMLEPQGRPNGRTLHVWVPAELDALDGRDAWLCLSLLARDGRYTGLLEAPFAIDGSAYRLEVSFETREAAYYAEERQEELAVLAEVKSRCEPGSPTHRVLPVSWEASQDNAQMTILVNSSRMRTLLVVPRREGRPLAIECQEIDRPQSVAFDKTCRLDFAGLSQRGELLFEQAALVRMRGPNPASPVPLPLAR